MKIDNEKFIDLLIEHTKRGVSDSHMPKDKKLAPMIKLMHGLHRMPKSQVPMANFGRVRNQILDRIAIPSEEPSTNNSWLGLGLQLIPRFLRISGGVIGSFLILLSLTLGTAAAALQSVPGQSIYPFKTVVENIQLKLAANETEKVNLQIKFANTRLEELEKVLEKNKQGKVSGAEVQWLVEKTIKDITATTASVSEKTSSPTASSSVNVLTKLVDLSSKQTALLQTASTQSEGEVKIELEKALEASKVSKEIAIENIERAGLRVEEKPIVLDTPTVPTNNAEAQGKITSINSTSVSIGTVKFFLTKDTKFVNITQMDLKADQMVSIKGETKDSKTYALEIKVEATTEKPEEPETIIEPDPETQEPQENQ